MGVKLYEHQQYALDSIVTEYMFGSETVLLEMGMGQGKTLTSLSIAIEMLKNSVDQVVIMMRFSELIDEFVRTITDMIGYEDYSICAGGYEQMNPNSKIIIAMTQSMVNHVDKLDSSKNTLLIIDEANVAYKTSSTNAVTRVLKNNYTLLLSGTPYTGDGYELENNLTIVKPMTAIDGMNKGYTVPIRYIKVPMSEVDESKVTSSSGEYNLLEQSAMYSTDKATNEIVVQMNKLDRFFDTREEKSIFFCPDTDACDALEKALQIAGYNAFAYHSKTQNQKKIMDSFKNDKLVSLEEINLFNYLDGPEKIKVRALISVAKLAIGFNVPDTRIAYFVGSSKRINTVRQKAFRQARKSDGKTECFMVDFGSNIDMHGDVYKDFIPYSLNVSIKEKRKHYKDNYSLQHLSIVYDSAEPYEVNVDEYKKKLDAIINDQTPLSDCSIKQLQKRFAISEDPFTLLGSAMQFCLRIWNPDNEVFHTKFGKECEGYMAESFDKKKNRIVMKPCNGFYNERSIHWILEDLYIALDEFPNEKDKIIKSFRTRLRSIVNNQKSIFGAKSFCSFILENMREEVASDAEKSVERNIPDIEVDIDNEIPF